MPDQTAPNRAPTAQILQQAGLAQLMPADADLHLPLSLLQASTRSEPHQLDQDCPRALVEHLDGSSVLLAIGGVR